MSQVIRKGPWLEERCLGSGGFGTVSLWKNEETGIKIALKRCRLQNEMTAKHKQRWQLEVQIMQRLQHENVIAAHVVPELLDVRPPELPLLAMEYCSGGDLRRILNQPQNCCGLSEFTIRCLVRDMASAVEYLHSKRIIHRDLKPENIVLKPVEERTIYKVIDLGYAKELDQGSVCTSFVGTLQYLAPELYTSQKYTCTVDYWSFGTVVFECIAGYRPFLPTSPPIKWHSEVCKKSPDDICARLEAGDEVKLHKSIPTANRLSRSMQTYMEQWLRMMLRWDPKARGGGLSKENRPACFTMLDSILEIKIIYVLYVSMNELLTFPVLKQHTMLDMQRRIEEETGIPVADQDIVLATGMTPETDQLAQQCWMEPSEQECFVYLFKKGGEDCSQDNSQRRFKQMPVPVQEIVREPSTMIPFQEQKEAWAKSVFFCEEQHLEFKRLVLSQRAVMLSLIRKDSIFVKIRNKMLGEWEQLQSKLDYFLERIVADTLIYGTHLANRVDPDETAPTGSVSSGSILFANTSNHITMSLHLDLRLYREQATSGGISSDKMCKEWMKMAEEVEGFKKLKDQVDIHSQQAIVIQTKVVELQKSPFARAKQDDTLQDLAKQARQVYQEFRQTAKDNKGAMRDQKPMVTVVVKSVMWRDKKLPDLYAHLGKIGMCKADLDRLQPQVENCLAQLISSSQKLIMYQKQRQSGVWKLVKAALNLDRGEENREMSQANDVLDASPYCRRENQPSPSMAGSVGPGGMQGSSMMMASLMSTSSVESLQVIEDSKVTSKMFEDAMNDLLLEDSFSTQLTISGSSISPT